uniref:Uncharacterized protein n=1 Tax=Nelumbo nucifera TaxID=4432 RepID=A0A822YBN0_NELNU|nr:TPA_asm: hypothetical protein HUJ06_030991 [Nelumbo nucifera]DAD30293.1 TPA_asm: hypothetical protein HUJ06_031761 [Nelumbo nucifera]
MVEPVVEVEHRRKMYIVWTLMSYTDQKEKKLLSHKISHKFLVSFDNASSVKIEELNYLFHLLGEV